MIPVSFFPYTLAALELSAAIVYAVKGDYRLAIVWAGVGVSNAAFAGIK